MSGRTLTPLPVCPHCGHVEHDAWEMNFGPGMEGDGTFSCASCGEEYFCSREVTIYYTTSKPGIPSTAKSGDGCLVAAKEGRCES